MKSKKRWSFYFLRTGFVLLAFLCFSVTLFSQETAFRIKFKFSVEQGGLENSLITITRDGQPYRVIDPNKGKYFVDLELNSEFKFTFTKPGHITKAIIVDTRVPNGREKEEQGFAKFDADVELNLQPADQIVTYSQPVGRIKYVMADRDFNFDNDYTQTAVEAQKKDKQNAKPKPKEPDPVKPVSNPEPIAIKQPERAPEPEKPKPKPVEPEIIYKPAVKDKEERVIQKDRLKITFIIVKVNDVSYEYKKEEYSWGGTYFYRDGQNITEGMFNRDTE